MTGIVKQLWSSIKRLFGAALLLLFLVYVYQQLFASSSGLNAWWNMRQEVQQLRQTNNALAAQVEFQEQQVERLYDKSLDQDFVEEQIQRDIGWGTADDEVIYLPVSRTLQVQ